MLAGEEPNKQRQQGSLHISDLGNSVCNLLGGLLLVLLRLLLGDILGVRYQSSNSLDHGGRERGVEQVKVGLLSLVVVSNRRVQYTTDLGNELLDRLCSNPGRGFCLLLVEPGATTSGRDRHAPLAPTGGRSRQQRGGRLPGEERLQGVPNRRHVRSICRGNNDDGFRAGICRQRESFDRVGGVRPRLDDDGGGGGDAATRISAGPLPAAMTEWTATGSGLITRAAERGAATRSPTGSPLASHIARPASTGRARGEASPVGGE